MGGEPWCSRGFSASLESFTTEGARLFEGVDAQISAQLRLFADQTRDLVGISDPWGRIVYLNPAARKRLGVADVAEVTITDVFPPEEFALYYDVARPELLRSGTWSGQIRVKVAGVGAVPMSVTTSAMLGPGGEINGLVVYARDVPRADAVVDDDRSDFDDVTGLLVASAFEHRLRLALAAAARDDDACALVLVDLLGMDATIEAFGHVAAVRVQRALAGRMVRLARTIDLVARVGEHRFALLLRHVRSHAEASRIAGMVYESATSPPVITAGGEIVVAVACGVACSRPGDDSAALTERATQAMSRPSRADGREDAVPSAAGRAAPPGGIDELRLALSRRELRPYAQPVVSLGSGAVVAYRGLARWQHPRLGALEAGAFIDLVSESPLANVVDLYVARETAAVVHLRLRDEPLSLYTPASRRLVLDVRTEQYLAEIADAYLLTMGQLRVQFARRLLDRSAPALRDALLSLRDAGVPLALTGVDAVADTELMAGAFSELHLSAQLTRAAAIDPAARLAAAEIVERAKDRGLLVLAAGVDRARERDVLIDLGCDLAHGDLFGPPEPADDID